MYIIIVIIVYYQSGGSGQKDYPGLAETATNDQSPPFWIVGIKVVHVHQSVQVFRGNSERRPSSCPLCRWPEELDTNFLTSLPMNGAALLILGGYLTVF